MDNQSNVPGNVKDEIVEKNRIERAMENMEGLMVTVAIDEFFKELSFKENLITAYDLPIFNKEVVNITFSSFIVAHKKAIIQIKCNDKCSPEYFQMIADKIPSDFIEGIQFTNPKLEGEYGYIGMISFDIDYDTEGFKTAVTSVGNKLVSRIHDFIDNPKTKEDLKKEAPVVEDDEIEYEDNYDDDYFAD